MVCATFVSFVSLGLLDWEHREEKCVQTVTNATAYKMNQFTPKQFAMQREQLSSWFTPPHAQTYTLSFPHPCLGRKAGECRQKPILLPQTAPAACCLLADLNFWPGHNLVSHGEDWIPGRG